MTTSANRWRVLTLGALMSFAAFASAHAAQQHFRVGVDGADQPCLPWRVFLLQLHPRPLERGQYAAFEVHGVPFYADGSVFTKQVAGVPGDRVRIEDGVVTVAGDLVARVEPRVAARLRKPMHAFDADYVLAAGQYFMVGTQGLPLDSRYLGPIAADQVRARAFPLW